MFNFDFLNNESEDTEWFYRDAFTIDPSQVEDAMETLTVDEGALMITLWPKIMHDAMISILKERKG